MKFFNKEILIKDVLQYERINDINILEELQSGNIFIILDLIKLGNDCSDEQAELIFNNALNENSLGEIIEQLAYELIGNTPNEKDEQNIDNTDKSISNILEEFYNQLQLVDDKLSISEFWNMSTRYMYSYADGIQERFIYNKNKQWKENYENIAMFMSGLTGKLKECPQLNPDGSLHKQSIKDKLQAFKMSQGSVR